MVGEDAVASQRDAECGKTTSEETRGERAARMSGVEGAVEGGGRRGSHTGAPRGGLRERQEVTAGEQQASERARKGGECEQKIDLLIWCGSVVQSGAAKAAAARSEFRAATTPPVSSRNPRAA